jgi:vacuolar-type H+-ATPase subunit H
MLENIKDFFKKFWGFFAAGLGIAVGFLLVKKKEADDFGFIQKLEDSHKKEIEEINKAREVERQQYEENEKKYKETMTAIQEQYEKAKKDLDEKKKTEVATIVRKYGNKPDQLAQKLSEVTGFKIILPED